MDSKLSIPQDHFFLLQALELAKIRKGYCAPNPSVGAVVVDDNQTVIATGYHMGCGSAHAEVAALSNLQASLKEATIYVTLEPCCHWGKTPPCTELLIQSNIKRVVFGYRDPNPIVAGKGELALKAAGIMCNYVSLPEIDIFYESYRYWHTNGRPFVTAKIAATLDGMIAKEVGKRIQITGPELQEFTHLHRKNCDAILTTARTIISDDPQFNARYKEEVIPKHLYILDSQLSLSQTMNIFKTAKSITVFYSNTAAKRQLKMLSSLGVKCVAIGADQQGLDLTAILKEIGKDGIHDLWVEAGGKCFSAFASNNLLQRIFIYIAPRWFGEGVPAFKGNLTFNESSQTSWRQIGNDVLFEWRPADVIGSSIF